MAEKKKGSLVWLVIAIGITLCCALPIGLSMLGERPEEPSAIGSPSWTSVAADTALWVTSTPTEVLTITQAIEHEKITVHTQGAGLSAVRVIVKKITPVSIQITIPIGTYFVNLGDDQDMVSTEEEVLFLTDQDESTTLVPAACVNLHRSVPEESSSFDIVAAPEQEELRRLIAALEPAKQSEVVTQVSVWIVIDDVSRSELDARYVTRNPLIPFGGPPAASDEDVINAIMLVSQSGISISEKRIYSEKVSLIRALPSDEVTVRSYVEESLGVQAGQSFSYLVGLLQVENPEIREAVVYALGRLGDPAAVDFLVSALNDPRSVVRREAVDSLEQLGEVEGLISALSNPDPDVRNDAVGTLRRIGDPMVVEPLADLLTDPEDRVRQSVCYALGSLGNPQAVPALIEALQDPDEYVRKAAVNALEQIGDERAIEPLQELLETEADEEFRQEIQKALDRLQRQ